MNARTIIIITTSYIIILIIAFMAGYLIAATTVTIPFGFVAARRAYAALK